MSSYRALLARPGARSVAFACGLGWLSFASYGLAIVLSVEAATGSFAVSGAAIAAFSVGAGVLAPARGRLVDRRGPRALAWFLPGHAAGIALLVLGCAGGLAPWLLAASAALAGASAPPLIATARAVWPRVAGAELAPTGHALNVALGDAAQVVGPALTATVAALASPLLALALIAPGAVVGTLLLSRFQVPKATKAGPAARRTWGVLGESAALRMLVACGFGFGVSLGAIEVAAPALAAAAGSAELAAVPLAAFALGSVAISLRSGARPGRSARSRYLAGAAIFAAALVCPLLVPSLAGFSVALLVAGAGFGLLNVALFELLDGIAPAHRAVEALTWLTTCEAVGLAAGALAAGQIGLGGANRTLVLVALPALATALFVGARSRHLCCPGRS
jgi:MFS family permease